METLDTIPVEDKKYFFQCSLCDHYYDIRDRVARLTHVHIQRNSIAAELATRHMSASVKAPRGQAGMIDLRKGDN